MNLIKTFLETTENKITSQKIYFCCSSVKKNTEKLEICCLSSSTKCVILFGINKLTGSFWNSRRKIRQDEKFKKSREDDKTQIKILNLYIFHSFSIFFAGAFFYTHPNISRAFINNTVDCEQRTF